MNNQRRESERLAEAIDREKVRTFQGMMLEWYQENGRHFPWREPGTSPYQLIVSELLLQRTRAEAVEKFYANFFERFPSWQDLADAPDSEIGEFTKIIGLWKRRAKTLRDLANAMVQRQGVCPTSREDIEKLPGVGQYIANAILLLCHGEAFPLLDSNMSRVLERVFGPRKLADIRYDPYLQTLARTVVECPKPREMNWAILDLAANICSLRNPRMERCPVHSICNFALEVNNRPQKGQL